MSDRPTDIRCTMCRRDEARQGESAIDPIEMSVPYRTGSPPIDREFDDARDGINRVLALVQRLVTETGHRRLELLARDLQATDFALVAHRWRVTREAQVRIARRTVKPFVFPSPRFEPSNRPPEGE